MIARTPQQEEHIRADVARGQRFGLDIDLISIDEARRLTPFLEPAAIHAVSYTRGDIYLEPIQIPLGYARAAARLGVTIRPRTTVTGIKVERGEVVGVSTDQGEILTPVVVSAAGAWTPTIGAMAGARLPVVPTRHQLLITEPIDGVEPHQPIIRIGDAQVYLRPDHGGLLVGGYEADPLQYAAADVPTSVKSVPLDLTVLRRLADRVVDQLPILRKLDVREHRGGLPTLTPDGRHVVGPVLGARGLFVIGGCCVAGLSISPSLGEALAAWVVQGEPPLDLSSLAVDRFGPEYQSDERLRSDSRRCYAEIYSTL
jgi:4-methylaminobutanoate oxidase (formaldehyde-forming)